MFYDLDHNSMIDRAEVLFLLRAMFQLLGMIEGQYSYEQCADTIMKKSRC